MSKKRLRKSSRNKLVAGVCTGLADYLNIDVTILRIAWIILVLFYGVGILAYIILWIVMPRS